MKIFAKFSIRARIFAGFLLIAAIMLSIAILSIYELNSMQEKEDNASLNIRTNDAVLEAKYFLRSDMHIVYEIQNAGTISELEHWWQEHYWQTVFINDQIKIFEQHIEASKLEQNNSEIEEIKRVTNQFSTTYHNSFLPLVEKIYLIKTKQIIQQPRIYKSVGLFDTAYIDFRINNLPSEMEISNISKKAGLIGYEMIRNIDILKSLMAVQVKTIRSDSFAIAKISIYRNTIQVIAGVIISILLAFYLSRQILEPLHTLKTAFTLLEKGIFPENLIVTSRDEIGRMTVAMNKIVQDLKKAADFANAIQQGNLNFAYTPRSAADDLGNALQEMRNKLKFVEEKQKMQIVENENYKWINFGLSEIDKILRTYGSDINKLSINVLQFIVKYIDAVQAGFFIISDSDLDDVHIKLIACVAYNRERKIQKRIEFGQSLVGRVIDEKNFILLSDIPENYAIINSGLGDTSPTNLLIMPLITNNIVHGAIEFLSFKPFDEHLKNFCLVATEAIALSVVNLKRSQKSSSLLEESMQLSLDFEIKETQLKHRIEELEDEINKLQN